MDAHRLDHLRVDAQDRIERHHRVLEDHRDAVAAQRLKLLVARGGQLLVLEADRAADDAARRIDEPEDREAGDGFARTGFADEAEDLAGIDVQRHAVDRLDDTRLGEEVRREIVDRQRRRDGGLARRPIRPVID